LNSKTAALVAFLFLFGFSGALSAQSDTDEKNPDTASEDDDEEAGDLETEEEDDNLGTSTSVEDEKFEEDTEDDDVVEPLALETPKKIDTSALGGLDPEEYLTRENVVDEDKIALQAVEEWTDREFQLLDIHGYFRVRPELYHKFHIRGDDAIFGRPMVQQIDETSSGYIGEDCRDDEGQWKSCSNSSLAGANMRFRIEPTFNASEVVKVKSQIDFLDNVMLGSTPRYYQNYENYRNLDGSTSVGIGQTQGWNMGPPDSSDMVVVRRAWGEVMTHFGQLRFGRMGDHWGLGMLHNDGNGIDSDFGDSVDRITFLARINDWILAPAIDFPNQGISSVDATGRPFDVSQLDDAYQLSGIFAYKQDEEDQAAALKDGNWIINTGLYFTYRWQVLSLALEEVEDDGVTSLEPRFYRRDMWSICPDFWFQFLYDTFHLEIEFALIYGRLGNSDVAQENFDDAHELTLVQYGGVLQVDYGLLSDQLRLGLEIGFASGDENVEGLRAPANYDQINGMDDTYSVFSFNPAYNTDLILYHHILGSISQSYYFHPWLAYDFVKNTMGKKIGIRADIIYSRAVWTKSTINDGSANLGVELNGQFYYSSDHFYAALKYGVLFPLKAFEGMPDVETSDDSLNLYKDVSDLDIPQTLQLMLGITF